MSVIDVLKAFARPLGRIADQLQRLNDNYERDLLDRKVPDKQRDEDVDKLSAEPAAAAPPREDWELALDEEIAERKAAENRAEEVP